MWCGVLHTWRTHTCTICGMWERCDVWRVSAPALCANYLFITPRLHDTNTACSASSVQAHCILCGGPAAKCSSLGVRRQDFETGLEMWLSVCAGMGLGIWVFGMGSGEWAGVMRGGGGGNFCQLCRQQSIWSSCTFIHLSGPKSDPISSQLAV